MGEGIAEKVELAFESVQRREGAGSLHSENFRRSDGSGIGHQTGHMERAGR